MAKPRATTRRKKGAGKVAEAYAHPVSVPAHAARGGYAAAIQKEKAAPPVTYRYDSSLSPSLDWDGGNGAREMGEWLLRVIEEAAGRPAPHTLSAPAEFRAADGQVFVSVGSLQEAVDQLKRLSRPFLDWTGKAERLSFDVPTLLPLFVHERLSTRAIVETLVGHKTDTQTDFWALLGDPRHSIADQVLKAYEYPDQWVNRLILGDSLVVMNSLLHYERLGGQVQMIYIDPPYGVKFGSNFQPFVRLDQPRMLADNDERRALIESLRVLSNDDIMRALQATGVLYLEGHTDLEILRAFAKVLNHPAQRLLTRDLFWKPTVADTQPGRPGIKAREHYDALRLVRGDLPALEVVDGDSRPEIRSSDIMGAGFQRWRWRRYEVESYLVHPDALERFVNHVVGAGSAPHVGDLHTYLAANLPPAVIQRPLEDHA